MLYLVFNEGYCTTSGVAALSVDLTSEVIRLARQVRRLESNDGEVAGLLALMLLIEARSPARSAPTAHPQKRIAALQHSVAAIAAMGTQLATASASSSLVTAWDDMVVAAQLAHNKLSNPSGSEWEPQEFLGYWHRANRGQRVS